MRLVRRDPFRLLNSTKFDGSSGVRARDDMENYSKTVLALNDCLKLSVNRTTINIFRSWADFVRQITSESGPFDAY